MELLDIVAPLTIQEQCDSVGCAFGEMIKNDVKCIDDLTYYVNCGLTTATWEL